MAGTTKLRKITPYSKRWEELAAAEARNYAPPIYPCGACDYPVVTGYCCRYCGEDNPSEHRTRTR